MFFSKPDPKKQAREQKRELGKLDRDLGKDRAEMERQEQMLTNEIKKAVRQGNQSLANQYAQQLVRVRKQKERSLQVSSTVKGVEYRTTAAQSNMVMAKAMTGATKVMASANKQMDVQAMQANMREFERQNMQMDMAEEMMNDTLDSVFDDPEDEEESQAVMNQIFDEIGLEVTSKMAAAPSRAPAVASASRVDEDLEARLARLTAL